MALIRIFFLLISLFFVGVAVFFLMDSSEKQLPFQKPKGPIESVVLKEWSALREKNQLPEELKNIREIRIPKKPLTATQSEALKFLNRQIPTKKDGAYIVEDEIFFEDSEVNKDHQIMIVQSSVIDAKSANKVSEFAITIPLKKDAQ